MHGPLPDAAEIIRCVHDTVTKETLPEAIHNVVRDKRILLVGEPNCQLLAGDRAGVKIRAVDQDQILEGKMRGILLRLMNA
jgi:hypothetical protein